MEGTVTISVWTVVDADSEEEAREIAEERGMCTLVYGATSDTEDEAWVLDELDGEPLVERVESES